MNLVTGIVVYLLAWWIILFTVLPWGNHPLENPESGHTASAPAKPRLGLKFLVTTVIAAIIWLLIYLLMKMELINFYDIAAQMIKEDRQ